ncbi:MAG: hypothetical protein ACTSXU_14245 [Promethearchaeota archaeon]
MNLYLFFHQMEARRAARTLIILEILYTFSVYISGMKEVGRGDVKTWQ